jgi:hypothetical protein
MKTITIKRLVLKNWKSLNHDVTFNSDTTTICARNGVGKSSLQKAWNWLLSGYTSAITPKNHELFDNRCELTHETPIASVKAFVIIDGVEYTIEKSAQAKFSRKRGTNEYSKDSSDVYKYYVDEIEVSATSFSEWISVNFCDYQMLAFCMDGTFFATLAEEDRKQARKVLEQIVGEIKPTDFGGDYSCLENEFAKGYTIEQIEERAKNRIKPLKKRQDEIPSLIHSKEDYVSQLEHEDYNQVELDIQSTKDTINEIDNQIIGKRDAIQPILGKRQELFEVVNSLTLKLNSKKSEYNNNNNFSINELNNQIRNADATNARTEKENNRIITDFKKLQSALERNKASLQLLEEKRNKLIKKRNEIKELVFDDDKCAFCGQLLPNDKLELAKKHFNEEKDEKYEDCIREGKNVRAEIDVLLGIISEMEQEISEGYVLHELINVEDLIAKKKTLEQSFIPFEDTFEYKTLFAQIQSINNSIPEIPNSNVDELIETKKVLLAKIEQLSAKLGGKFLCDNIKQEILTLKKEQNDIAVEIATIEQVLAKCKEYVEERADVISFRVNDKLENCKILMYEFQKNGELTPSCVVTSLDGVKYSTLNNSNRLKTCISLQSLFCKHHNIAMPIFIDEANCFDSTNKPKVNGQQTIFLEVSDDNYLTVK